MYTGTVCEMRPCLAARCERGSEVNDTNGPRELLTADEVARYLGLRPTTIYQWCREGRLPCLKLGKEWRVRRGVLEAFLEQREHRVTLAAQLRAFLAVPDDVLGIAGDEDHLHRLDAAFFQAGETRDALLVKFTGGEPTPPAALRTALERGGLAASRLEREGRLHLIPGTDPTGEGSPLRELVRSEGNGGRIVFASFDWTRPATPDAVTRQRREVAEVVNPRQLVAKTALLEAITDDWLPAEQRRAQDAYAGVIWLSERGLGLRRVVPLQPD